LGKNSVSPYSTVLTDNELYQERVKRFVFWKTITNVNYSRYMYLFLFNSTQRRVWSTRHMWQKQRGQ